jgi:hypothetical protein
LRRCILADWLVSPVLGSPNWLGEGLSLLVHGEAEVAADLLAALEGCGSCLGVPNQALGNEGEAFFGTGQSLDARPCIRSGWQLRRRSSALHFHHNRQAGGQDVSARLVS